MSYHSEIKKARQFLKDSWRKEFDFSQTAQAQGLPPPPLEKPVKPNQKIIPLLPPRQWKSFTDKGVLTAIRQRRSCRNFISKPISQEELAILLWVTQGVLRKGQGYTLRTVPSAGARHALETYVCAMNIADLKQGVYRYLPLSHSLVEEFLDNELRKQVILATFGQEYVGQGACFFCWSAMCYRMEWRYGPGASKAIALDAGHVCQNLYLACEIISCGCCAIGAYDQERLDGLLGLDSEEEFVVYSAVVGKRK
ncbi:MAG: SagB/ThcOx family dehydrogenase [Candidatus Omnitrophica bacterium]|nr:SagB/ThcOx family dehydrogenase [Candidatus Omnitrophota bacterium]